MGLGVGGCEFYERMVGELVGEVWLDVLHRKMPEIWAFLVKNAPGLPCKIIRLFPPMTDYRISPNDNWNVCSILRNYRFSIICAAIINTYTIAAHI